jgi:hypothetical protein
MYVVHILIIVNFQHIIFTYKFLNVSHLTIYVGQEGYFHPLLLIEALVSIINGTIIIPRSIFESLDISMFLSILVWVLLCHYEKIG